MHDSSLASLCGVLDAGFGPKIPNFDIQAFLGPQKRLKTETPG
jgi:hypothetical protein